MNTAENDMAPDAGHDDIHNEAAGNPREMLALLQSQQRRVDQMLLRPIPWLLAIWGVAWLVGFLVLWLGYQDGDSPFSVPMVIAGPVFAALIIGSIVASALIGTRINRGVKGTSNFSGAVYGISWSLSSLAAAALGVGLISNGMSQELASLYFPSVFSLMAGTLYLSGAAIWRDVSQLIIGIILLVVGSIAPFFGAPTNNLVMGLLGGGTFLIAAAVFAIRLRRSNS